MSETPYFGKKIFAGSYRCPKSPTLVILSKKTLKIAKNAKIRQKMQKNAENRQK